MFRRRVSSIPNNDVIEEPTAWGRQCWRWCRYFLLSFLASLITAAIAVLILALLYVKNNKPSSNPDALVNSPVLGLGACLKEAPFNVDTKFLFLNNLHKAKANVYQGGLVSCAGYLGNSTQYSSMEAAAFGISINTYQSKISVCTIRIFGGGLYSPAWTMNGNIHGYVSQGAVWVGIVQNSTEPPVTFNVITGQVMFIPQGFTYWIRNTGNTDAFIVMFYSTDEEIITLDVSDVLFFTPNDIKALMNADGVSLFGARPTGTGVIILPDSAWTYTQSANTDVWRYFFNLAGSFTLTYPGGKVQWARSYVRPTYPLVRIFSTSLRSFPNTLSLGLFRIYPSAVLLPHYYFNANTMGYVLSGCGQVGVVGCVATNFDIEHGDVFFFPTGTMNYIRSTCNEDLVIIVAYSVSGKLETIFLNSLAENIRSILEQMIRQLQASTTSTTTGPTSTTTTTTTTPTTTTATTTTTTTTTTTPSTTTTTTPSTTTTTTPATTTLFTDEQIIIYDPDTNEIHIVP
ncbi:uncharacterized protein LOC115461854 [Microcaecilia unicolor]|uniref:Uncharacterized protein LOC115461854 n=1 Tax=Microcaecilia unicolor TaxID=1415580 RepID=A0A6P7XB24_9AMPH|nr:uncharacterized protein LOC115461854 [Microcaecilia unicolor]